MPYIKTTWVNDIPGVQEGTPVDAANMNKIEQGIFDATAAVENIRPVGSTIYAYKNLGGAL